MQTEQQLWLPGLAPEETAESETASCENDLWAGYRKAMSQPLTADELQGFGRQGKHEPAIKPFVDIKLINRRGRKGVDISAGVKGTF